MILKEDSRIRDTYEVDLFLGEGAFAEVYRVKHKFLGRQAMKVFKFPSPQIKEIERDLAEATLLSKIGHPNIIRVFDAGILETDAGMRGYFTMEYVPGGTLESFWHSHRGSLVPIADTVNIIRQVCIGLAVSHSEQPPIIHRDIKPQNILVGYDVEGLRIRISDFGLAKAVNPLTLIASSRGTPAFKAPECMENMDSCAGDVWGVGVTLYLLLTDRLPFPVESRMDLTTGKCWKHPFIPASEFNPRIDDKLESIVSRSLKLNSNERYSNAMEMLEDLMQWEAPKPKGSIKDKGSADISKTALGSISKPDNTNARALATEALNLAQNASKIMEAADLLEEALTKQPDLRQKYEYQLRLWRRGISV